MNRFLILTLFLTTLLTSCINGPKASINDLQVTNGIREGKLTLDGSENVSTTFSFIANHDWAIIDYKGFTCDPSSGANSINGEIITVTAKPLRTNNTADTIRLSDLNFKLLSTRFVGISAYQLPQIRFPEGKNKIVLAATGNSTASLKIASSSDDIELKINGEIEATLSEKNDKKEHTITVKVATDNATATEQHLGTIGFVVDGVDQESKIEVYQTAALTLDRSEVILPSCGGGQNLLEVNSVFEIEASKLSEEFTLTRKGNTFTITALRDNNGTTMSSLGSIDIWLKDTPDCKTTIEVKQRAGKAPQTVIIHFIGTALKYYFNQNIDKILEGLSSNIQGNAQVLAITTDSSYNATMYELRYDKNLGTAVKEKVKELSLSVPYNAALFEANLRKALQFAPAEKYALILGSHGLAWVPKYQYEPAPQQLKRLGFCTADLWKRNPNAEMTRHMGDGTKDNYNTLYNVEEIAEAIAANNVKFEYILFDACFMSNVESAYAFRNATNYIVASPCEVMGYGFPYAKIMQYILANNGTSYNLDKICREYVNYYKSEAATKSACVAITNTAELEALAQATKAVNMAGIQNSFSLDNVQYYEGQSPHSFYDLGDLVEQSCIDASVATAFKKQLDKTVTSRYHTDQFYSAYGANGVYYHDIKYYTGITTSAMVDHYEYDWKETEWYSATHEKEVAN